MQKTPSQALFRYNPLDANFIILAPEHNLARIKSTVKSINVNCGNPCICVVGNNTTKQELEELKELCPVYKGKDTITSLMNAGLSKGGEGWNIFVMEGVWLKPNVEKRYNLFAKDYKDILYPIMVDYDRSGKVIQTHTYFFNCSLNGIAIHQKNFKEIGKFLEKDSLEDSRTEWAARALENNASLKGILGIKII